MYEMPDVMGYFDKVIMKSWFLSYINKVIYIIIKYWKCLKRRVVSLY